MGRSACATLVLWAVAGIALSALPVRAQGPSPEAWQRLSPEERARARRNYERFQQLPEKDRQGIHERYQRWQNFRPEQRERLRENYESYRDLNPTERQRFDNGYRDWKQQGGGAGPDR